MNELKPTSASVAELEVLLADAFAAIDELFGALKYDLDDSDDVDDCAETLPSGIEDHWREWRSDPERRERAAARRKAEIEQRLAVWNEM